MVPALLSLTSIALEKVVPLLWVTVSPASACELPTVPTTLICAPVPASKVKVRSLLVALSPLMASLKVIPPVAVTATFAPSTTSPVTLSTPLPKLTSPLKV